MNYIKCCSFYLVVEELRVHCLGKYKRNAARKHEQNYYCIYGWNSKDADTGTMQVVCRVMMTSSYKISSQILLVLT